MGFGAPLLPEVVSSMAASGDSGVRGVQPYVELHAVGALFARELEGREGVLRSAAPRPTMAEHPGARAGGAMPRAQPASSSAISRATLRARSSSLVRKEMPPTTGWPPPPWRAQMAEMSVSSGAPLQGL